MKFIGLFLCVFLCVVVGIFGLDSFTPAIAVGSPVKAIYIDWHLNWNAPDQTLLQAVNAGYNVIIISFYLSGSGPTDMAQAWVGLSASAKQSAINSAHAAGAVVTVSLGGTTDSPYGMDGYTLGTTVGKWAKAQLLDGVDFDLENLAPGFRAGSLTTQQTIDWISNVTLGAHDGFGSNAVISHAPQAPYFGPVGSTVTWVGTSGGYTAVYQKVGNYITFFNVQFYNQGATCYADFNGLFVSSSSCSSFPQTSVSEIAKAGVPLSKIVVGKPVTSADAGSGWVSASTLHSWFQQAQSQLGWKAGVMGWVWNDPTTLATWISTIY